MPIVVRSYGRAEFIRQMTLKVLEAQKDLNLEKELFLVVHESEVGEYEKALRDYPHAGLIVKTEKGGNNSIKAAHEYFSEGEPLVFLDDDIPVLKHYVEEPSKESLTELTNLGAYIEDAWQTLQKTGLGRSWTATTLSNTAWTQGKPWKEFRPHIMWGSFWAAYNSPLILTDFAHEDDRVRSAKYIEEFGGTLVYNWLWSKGGGLPIRGGMQSSGDRASLDQRAARTLEVCQHLLENDPLYRKYHTQPRFREKEATWSVRQKSITAVSKIRPFQHVTWSTFFQAQPDEERDLVRELFGEER